MPPNPMSSTRPGTAAYNRSRGAAARPFAPLAAPSAGGAAPPRPCAKTHCAAGKTAATQSTNASFLRLILLLSEGSRSARSQPPWDNDVRILNELGDYIFIDLCSP